MSSAKGPIGAILDENKIIAIFGEWECELTHFRYSVNSEIAEGQVSPDKYYTIALYLDSSTSKKRYEATGLICTVNPLKIEGYTGLEYKEE